VSVQGHFSNSAAGINNNGQMVFNSDVGPTTGGYLYSGGNLTELPTLGGFSGMVHAINDQGQIVGAAMTAGPYRGGDEHAYLDSAGTIQDLGTLPGDTTSEALGINNAGAIVGDSETGLGIPGHGFLDVNGTMYDLNALVSDDSGYLITSAVAINADGQIAADAITPSGQEHAVLLTPTATALPLPPAFWASLTALPLLLVGKRLRRAVV
jgi:probable HAF family extracellular repeat protein